MRTSIAMLLLGYLMMSSAIAGQADDRVAASRAAVKEFSVSLKDDLQKAIEEGGPAYAIGVCNIRAPKIAQDLSAKKGWLVARTSLKLRNLNNVPDEWERAVLLRFEERKAVGEDPKAMEHFEVVQQNSKQVFRYMKAIPTAPLCVTCHGAKVDPAVEAKLKELYPQDKARGFNVGDIRGAFTITQLIDTNKEWNKHCSK